MTPVILGEKSLMNNHPRRFDGGLSVLRSGLIPSPRKCQP
jgi:hypothetical protein